MARGNVFLGPYASEALATTAATTTWGAGVLPVSVFFWNTTLLTFEQWDGTVWRISSYAAVTGAPTGFPSRTTSEITGAVALGVGSVTIAPTGVSFDFFQAGIEYIKSAPDTLPLAAVEGLHYLYYNAGVLTETTLWSDDLILTYPLASIAYWDATNNVFTLICDERHGVVMDTATHLYEHVTEGMRYRSGLTPNTFSADGTGNDAANAQFGVTTGIVADEDNEFTISPRVAPANIRVFWREGVGGGWRMRAADDYPMIYAGDSSPYAGALVPWNEDVAGTWQLTSTTNGDYLLIHLFANNALTAAGAEDGLMIVMGQAKYLNITQAREGATTELAALKTNGLPIPEMVAIATMIVQVNALYANVPKARIRTNDLGTDFIDWRGQNLIAQASAAADHAALNNLDWEDEAGHTGEPYKTPAFTDTGEATSVRAGLENVVYVDTGVNTVTDGSQAFPFHDIQTAINAASAGDTVLIAPGTYTITVGVTSKADVKLQGYGCGGLGTTPTGAATIIRLSTAATKILTVDDANFQVEGIRFLVDTSDTAALPLVTTGGGGALFTNCAFIAGRASDSPAFAVDAAVTVTFSSCGFSGNAAYAIFSMTAAGTATLTSCQSTTCNWKASAGSIIGYTSIFTVTGGGTTTLIPSGTTALTLTGCTVSGGDSGIAASNTSTTTLTDTTVTGGSYGFNGSDTAALTAYGSYFPGGVRGISITGNLNLEACFCHGVSGGGGTGIYFNGTGNLYLYGNVIRGDGPGHGLNISQTPAVGPRAVDNLFEGGVGGITVATAITAAFSMFSGNVMANAGINLVGTGKLTCAANKIKYVGGSYPDRYNTIAGAWASAQAGDVIQVAPGTYTSQIITTPATGAGVTLRGSGCGGVTATTTGGETILKLSSAGTLLTVSVADIIIEGIRFVCDTLATALLPTVTVGASNTVFRDCHFRSTVADAQAAVLLTGVVYLDRCYASSVGNVISVTGATVYADYCNFPATFTVSGGQFYAAYTEIATFVSAGAADVSAHHSRFNSAATAFTSGSSGVLTLRENVVSGGVYGVSFTANPGVGSRVDSNTISGTTYDVRVGDLAVTLTSFKDNSLAVSGVYLDGASSKLVCVANTVKYVGAAFVDRYYNLAMAMISTQTGDDIVVGAGTYATAGLAQPAAVTGLTIRGVSRERVAIGTGVDTTVFTVGDDAGLVLEDLTLTGPIDVTGTAASLIVRNVVSNGIIEIQNTVDAATTVRVYNSRFSPTGSTGVHGFALIIAKPELNSGAVVYLYDSYFKGDGTVAVRFIADTGNAASDQLRIAHCTMMHGSLDGNNPMSASADTPDYYSHHTTWNSDPEAIFAFFNLLNPGSNDIFTPLGDY